MMSKEALELFNTIVYIWFALGAGLIGVFAAKELWFLIKGTERKEK
jgi:hypothetical protein